MKKTTLAILGGAAVATALFLSSNNVQPPPVPMFSFAWNNNYSNSHTVTFIIASDKVETPISQWNIIAATQEGRYSEPMTNGNRFYSVINYDPDEATFSLPW